MLSDWIDKINIKTLLKYAPYGFLSGCGETSEYICYAFRTMPKDEDELFKKLNRQGEYYDSFPLGKPALLTLCVNNDNIINETEYTLDMINQIIFDINSRLDKYNYARVSFMNNNIGAEKHDITYWIKNKPEPLLFDHSFIILKYNRTVSEKKSNIWRIESYIDQYGPRIVDWENYEHDILKLLSDPINAWKKIFGVKCDNIYNSDNIKVYISN
jgi:hypothetical protein